METIYLDFDNTIVESHKRIIEIINNNYNVNKKESDLIDYGYKSIYPLSQEQVVQFYESDDFFENLTFKPMAFEVYNKYKDLYNIIITTKGTDKNLKKKEKWLRDNLDKNINFIGATGNSKDKSAIDMKDGIQIDDICDCLNTNAKLHILYKSFNDFDWQKCCGDIVCVNTWEEIDEILSFCLKYNYKTLKERED